MEIFTEKSGTSSRVDQEYLTLTELGLNKSQAKIFLFLAKAGSLTAQEIAKATHVARPHVYGVLSELEDAGLVVRIIDQPERFNTVNIVDGVSALMQRRINKNAELQEKVGDLIQNFRTMQLTTENQKNSQFMLIPKKGAVYAKSEKLLSKVDYEINFLCLTNRMISWLSTCQPLFEKALTRKVKCKVIMPNPKANSDFWKPIKSLRNFDNFNMKFIPDEPNFGFSIWDRREILLTTLSIDSPTPANTLWSNNKGLVALCREHFNCIWDKAEKYSINNQPPLIPQDRNKFYNTSVHEGNKKLF